MSFKFFFILIISMLFLTSCSVKKYKNLDYLAPLVKEAPAPTLNIFAKRKKANTLQPVLIFVYGGNWNSGKKETYNYVGRNFARHDVILVMPDYTKSPKANYEDMTKQIAQSIKWTKENIEAYGGDPNQIFITGHSAGAHLGALAVMNPSYQVDINTVKGILLNDAAGLDMYSYLLENQPTAQDDYIATWTEHPENWKAASPYYFIDKDTPKMKIYTGTKSYRSIINGNERFVKKLNEYQPDVSMEYLEKKHAAMVVQLFFPWNKRIDEMVQFMKK